jgi:hypothetical protein
MATVAFRALMGRMGLNDATRDAIRDQGIEDMESLTEINQEDIKDLVNNVMKYQAPLVAAGTVSIPCTARKRIQTARYWIDTRS